jgi:hypothetical protein
VTPEERTVRAQLASHESWARTLDPTARTENARRASDKRFETKVRAEFPDLPDADVARLAEHARKAHYKRMQLLSAKARRERSGAA